MKLVIAGIFVASILPYIIVDGKPHYVVVTTEHMYIGGSALVGISSVYYEDPKILLLVDEIIRRESGGDQNACNKKYGCAAGMGLTQLIPSTVKYCERKIGKEINPFDPDDNVECAIWLLKNEGIRHWQPYSGDYSNFIGE